MGRYLLALGGTGSAEGGNGWYLVVLGQYRAVIVDTCWYYRGSFRKNGKSNLHSRGVYFHKISIFATFPSLELMTNYSSSPSRSLRILFSLASKVAVSLYEERGGQRKVAQGDFGTITRYFGQPWRPRNKVTKQRRGLLISLFKKHTALFQTHN